MDQPEKDEQLIGRLADGDTVALEALYDRYSSLVFALVLRIVVDRQIAEELLQEVFVRVWQHAGAYEATRGRVLSWLLGIAHNLALNELRRRRRRPQGVVSNRDREAVDHKLEVLAASGPEPAEVAWANMRRAQLMRALDHLPAAQRAVIGLYAIGHSQSEIATRLGEPLGTVKSRMRLGLRKLRDILQAQGIESD